MTLTRYGRITVWSTVRWFSGGKVDHAPATILAGCPKVVGMHDVVRDHPGIQSWYARY